MKRNADEEQKKGKWAVRALRVELIKPLSETWESVGPLMRTLAAATPKVTNAAYDARVAALVAGSAATKAAVCPDTRGASPAALAYQAALRSVERLRDWGMKKKLERWAALELPGGMVAAIAQVANSAFEVREKKPPRFSSERILVRRQESAVVMDERGPVLDVMLRKSGRVRFALMRSTGRHAELLRKVAIGEIARGDVKIQWDERRRKWYALIAYEPPEPVPMTADPRRVLAVHRGMRSAFFMLASTGPNGQFPGAKYVAQRRALESRKREARRLAPVEVGAGARGHGKARRFEFAEKLGDKLARATHTFCQQAAAHVDAVAERHGCATVFIEDYGGIVGDDDRAYYIGRFPFNLLKLALESRLELSGRHLVEVPSGYISSTCPCCEDKDERYRNVRTNVFHCGACGFQRGADWVAAFNMLRVGGANVSELKKRLEQAAALATSIKKETA